MTSTRRRVTVPFSGRDTAFDAWFEYDPARYNTIIQRGYRMLRNRGMTAAADAFLLGSLLTAWAFDYPVTPAAIGMFGPESTAELARTILADLTTYQSVIAMDLRTTTPPVSA